MIQKTDGQTYVEFSSEKETYFDKWIQSKNIEDDDDRLRQLILIEDLRECILENIKIYLEETKVDTVYEMATRTCGRTNMC